MTFPDVKGDPMTTDTPTNRHDEALREQYTYSRAVALIRAFIVRAVGHDAGGGMTDQALDLADELQAEDLLREAPASSLPAGLPTPPEASDLGGGRMRWHPTAGLVVESPEDGTGRVRLAVRTGLRAISVDDARLLAAILLAAADVAEGGTR